MESDIKLDKIDAGENYEEHPQDDDIEEIGKHVTDLCEALVPDNSRFSKERFLDILLYFIEDDKRILYSQVTNFIFGSYKKSGSLKEASGIIDNMTTNLVSMIEWTKSDGFKGTSNFQELFKGDSGKLLKLRKVLVKLWDHINLANHQYNQLKESDEEFDKKFGERFKSAANKSLNEFSKEMNTQLLTLVGIFTALAFMVFGSITGLSNLITNVKQPVPRLIILGCVWGIAVLNLVFVFLFCVGKMTNANFASTDNPSASIWEKYPIVWWSDFAIGSILVLSSWLYYLKNRHGLAVLDDLLLKHPGAVFYGGSAIIFVVIGIVFHILKQATGVKKNSKNLS
jgi:hypothetical protein